jgi:hypothetical protein
MLGDARHKKNTVRVHNVRKCIKDFELDGHAARLKLWEIEKSATVTFLVASCTGGAK